MDGRHRAELRDTDFSAPGRNREVVVLDSESQTTSGELVGLVRVLAHGESKGLFRGEHFDR